MNVCVCVCVCVCVRECKIVSVCVKPSSQYGKNARRTFDAMLKHEDRIDFYPCVADAPVDASERTCHKFIAEISCVIIVQNPLDA